MVRNLYTGLRASPEKTQVFGLQYYLDIFLVYNMKVGYGKKIVSVPSRIFHLYFLLVNFERD